jgi:hypothetical protein
MPVPIFDLKFLLRTCSDQCRNFKSAALAGKRIDFDAFSLGEQLAFAGKRYG